MTPRDRVTAAFIEDRDDVYRYLLIFGLQPADAQDVTQEAFLKLLASLRRGDQIQNPRAWVFRVAHNLAIRSSARSRTQPPLKPELEFTLADGNGSVEAALLHSERLRRLASEWGQLSSQQRRCLHLRAEGLRYEEIAATIGVGVSTVGKFLSRAITRLRKALQ